MSSRKQRIIFAFSIGLVLFSPRVFAEKFDYASHKVKVTDPDWSGVWTGDKTEGLIDGIGTEPYPVSSCSWRRADVPSAAKKATVIFDYGRSVKVAALVHYFYVPGNRDHRDADWCAGPSAFQEVKIYVSSNQADWQEVSHLNDLPTGCPQTLVIEKPVESRYLRLEVIRLAEGAAGLNSYEIETYTDAVPNLPDRGELGKAELAGYCPSALEAAGENQEKKIFWARPDRHAVGYTLPIAEGDRPLTGSLDILVDGVSVIWQTVADTQASGTVQDHKIEMQGRAVKAGLLLTFRWHGRTAPRYPKLEILAGIDGEVTEWCVPSLYYDHKRPDSPIEIRSSGLMNTVTMIGDTRQTLAMIPDTDQSWIGLTVNDKARIAYPLRGSENHVLLAGAAGNWESMFRKAVEQVFDFNEPRQCYPVSKAVPELCRFIMSEPLWSEKYQMLRSFPDRDFFYIFYSLPYCIPALGYWETMTADPAIADKVDKIVRFTLARRFFDGPMKGALFAEYADIDLVRRGEIPYAPIQQVSYCLPDERLVGMDQAVNRWVTSHTMGAVLWSVSQLWYLRGDLPADIRRGSDEIADWMVKHMREDGSWPYAYHPDGTVVSPTSDSGTIWNVWSLYRWGRLTGQTKYQDAARKAEKYFKETFTIPRMYRGYWEDHYPSGKTVLDTGQGYESSIAVFAFAEMDDAQAVTSSLMDCLKFVCTRRMESRTYFTSYGQAAESTGCAPGTYIVSTVGRAAQLCQQKTGDSFYQRYANIAKTIGWWQDRASGGGLWMSMAFLATPIEVHKEQQEILQFWAIWDNAQKVAFTIPWLVDEVNRRSGKRMAIDSDRLRGKDDLGNEVVVRNFEGDVRCASGQVNWLYLKTLDAAHKEQSQLILINHAEATDGTVILPAMVRFVAARGFDDHAASTQSYGVEADSNSIKIHLPEKSMTILVMSDSAH